MAWIESHQTLREHPKVYVLVDALGVSKAQVLGHLHLLWWWCVDYALDGVISQNDVAIARAAEWPGDAKAFVAALVGAEFLDRADGVLTIHDWLEYCGTLVAKRLERQSKSKTVPARKPKIPERAPTVPNRTVPNQTQPHQEKDGALPPQPRRIFKPPTAVEVAEFSRAGGYVVDSERFCSHYESNGWKVGRNPMRDWKAAVRNWHFRDLKGGFNAGNNRGTEKPIVGGAKPVPGKYANVGQRFTVDGVAGSVGDSPRT